MDASGNKAEFKTALKVGLICGIAIAVLELYTLFVGLGSVAVTSSIYQTLWLLGAFIIAMAGVWTVRQMSKGIKNIYDAALYSGLAGVVAGVIYVIAVIITEFIIVLYDNLRYFYLQSFIGDVIGNTLSSFLWLPVVVAVAIFGGIVYYTLVKKAE